MRPEAIAPLQAAFQAFTVSVHEAARSVVIYRPDYVRRSTGGHVGVISAGTSDIPVAEEAALIAQEMGCHVTCIYDVGVRDTLVHRETSAPLPVFEETGQCMGISLLVQRNGDHRRIVQHQTWRLETCNLL